LDWLPLCTLGGIARPLGCHANQVDAAPERAPGVPGLCSSGRKRLAAPGPARPHEPWDRRGARGHRLRSKH